MSDPVWPIGVFASVDAGLGVSWDVIADFQVPTIQLHAPHPGSRDAADAKKLREQLSEKSIRCTAVFGGFEGESYADIPTVSKTVGLVPLETRQSRLREMYEISDFAKHLGCDTIALHLGFVPEESSADGYGDIVAVTRQLCDHASANGQFVHLETGQETADGLLHFLGAVERKNLRINFDPANMVLYGTGAPIPALKQLADHLGSVHCKDANASDRPGETWGQEVPLGHGQVDIALYLQTLKDIGYTGPLTIEREIPEDPQRQREEIGGAVELLRRLTAQIL
ncbi:MAG: sugar phosphate isomerase/epimerase family protein [Planctomycetota bacterium]